MPVGPGNVTFLHDLPVELVVELGRAQLTILELSRLERDDVVELDRHAAQPLDVLVGGKLFARGEVVVVDDQVVLKIVEIVNQEHAETA
jgi:flagellar motor switch protein FliN/FliY